eukprot:CAMPEP_0118711492 /NCGR_PEP_ID=MMETSP0800-20121206/24126_1 /TAXON_ID=210618 ORGANISM="Striatella unipunctata, Strain CCMP2910" /NCGR_SAMPLE_ID=MMETSP0800 /ASSEMBLY_ACC=CAM_ASM_000638 /LENGTH=289 /DNA_ID=CAMNT_0006616109 /DNA_START=75 /DNA_END=941 /DNA_ORIENTATION=-
MSSSSSDSSSINLVLQSRFPTSVDDQVRQCREAYNKASADGYKRHTIQLLLPLIGATELDDWPGGAPQMMDAALPLVKNCFSEAQQFQDFVLNNNVDEVRAVLVQQESSKDDACAILLPTADTVVDVQQLDETQVGPSRNLLLVNPQWKRKTDFANKNMNPLASFFGGGPAKTKEELIEYIESNYIPTYYCSNVIIEGEQLRILRSYPSPWKVYLFKGDDWVLIGEKPVVTTTRTNQETIQPTGMAQQDGGRLFDFGLPNYQEMLSMIKNQEDYVPKSVTERATSAFNF